MRVQERVSLQTSRSRIDGDVRDSGGGARLFIALAVRRALAPEPLVPPRQHQGSSQGRSPSLVLSSYHTVVWRACESDALSTDHDSEPCHEPWPDATQTNKPNNGNCDERSVSLAHGHVGIRAGRGPAGEPRGRALSPSRRACADDGVAGLSLRLPAYGVANVCAISKRTMLPRGECMRTGAGELYAAYLQPNQTYTS